MTARAAAEIAEIRRKIAARHEWAATLAELNPGALV